MRAPLAVLLVLMVFPFPTAAADESAVDTTPRTRDYVDPATLLVYHYDAGTNTLTPTGEFATSTALYMDVDVYRTGQMPKATTGAAGACNWDFCVSALTAVVGARSTRLEVVSLPSDAVRCPPKTTSTPYAPLLGVVTFFMVTSKHTHCAPGRACAHLYVDGVVRASDCSTY